MGSNRNQQLINPPLLALALHLINFPNPGFSVLVLTGTAFQLIIHPEPEIKTELSHL